MSNRQTKMVEAYMERKFTKLHKLQYQAAMSFEFRAYAVRKVVSNDGKRTAGVDKVIWNNPRLKFQAISRVRMIILHPKKYKPKLIKRVWIPKPDSDELRPLGIPTMDDRAVQTLISLVLDPVAEELSDQYSYGFRKHKSVHDAVHRVRFLIDKSYSPKWILDVDIKNCFDTMSHEFINKEVKPILFSVGRNFIKDWLITGIVEKGTITHPKAGTPQGGVISPILCNLCLNGVESIVRPNNPKVNTKEYKALRGCWSVRYADDMLLFARTETRIVNDYLPKLKKFLKVRGLKISKQKSKIINLEKESLSYLGWTFKLMPRNLKYNKPGKNKLVLLTKPSRKGIRRVMLKIKYYFKLNAPLSLIIRKLNPILRGWINYYRISYGSAEVFSRLSWYILTLFWRWAKRIHPRENKWWIKKKYIFSTQTHSWIIGFVSSIGIPVHLVKPATIKTIKVKAVNTTKNPYYDKEYFDNEHKVLTIMDFRRKVYIKHKYKCAACGEILDENESVELHRINAGKDGGKYTLKNTVPLHKTCHESVTFAKNQWFKHLNIRKS